MWYEMGKNFNVRWGRKKVKLYGVWGLKFWLHLLRIIHSMRVMIVMQPCFRSVFDSCSIKFFYVQKHELDMHSHLISLWTNWFDKNDDDVHLWYFWIFLFMHLVWVTYFFILIYFLFLLNSLFVALLVDKKNKVKC